MGRDCTHGLESSHGSSGDDSGGTIELDRVVATFGRPGRRVAVITRRPQGYFLWHVEGRRRLRVNG